jgi:hypothetical protein
MSSPATLTPASAALESLVALLEEHGIEATRDAGAFYPDPIGVLVGLPSWTGSTLAGRVYTVPVLVVAGQPLNTPALVDLVYYTADAIADAVAVDSYRPSSWSSSSRPEPLPCVEILATVTATIEEV